MKKLRIPLPKKTEKVFKDKKKYDRKMPDWEAVDEIEQFCYDRNCQHCPTKKCPRI